MNISNLVFRQVKWQPQMQSNFETMWYAGVVEIGELVESMGHADWKKQDRDEMNLLVEAADIVIFAINCLWYQNEDIETDVNLTGTIGERFFTGALLKAWATEDFNYAISLCINQFPMAYDYALAKQALNQLRQDNGYKTGDYIKNWGTRSTAMEDNQFLQQVIGQNMSYDEMYSHLNKIYQKVKESRLPMN